MKTSRPLQPGEYEDVAWVVPATTKLKGPIFAVADDLGGLKGTQQEYNENNNTISVSPCTAVANWTNYGEGWPGTLGVPGLRISAIPHIGAKVDILVDSSSRSTTIGYMYFGVDRDSKPSTLGGTVLVDPLIGFYIGVDPGTTVFQRGIPCIQEWCGCTFYFQVLIYDTGATKDAAFSKGLEIVVGQ